MSKRKSPEIKVFDQIAEYLSLGNRIGNGLLNIFEAIFTKASEGKTATLAQFSYTVDNDPAAIYFIFTLASTSSDKPKTAKVEVVIKDGVSYMALRKRSSAELPRYPMSAQGVKDILKDAKLI